MPKTHATWTVLPHGPIEELSDRLWRIEGALDGSIPLRRVMTVARRVDGTLVIHNAIGLGAAEMAAIDRWGKVAVLVVPNASHRLDAPVFHARYPDARVLCPAGARTKVAEVVPVAGAYEDLTADGCVELVTLDGTRRGEGAMIVRGADGLSLVLNDAVFNMPHLPGLKGFVLRRITGSSGGPRVSRVMKLLGIADKPAFRAHLERLAALPDLRRIVVSHHAVIDRDASATLARVAASV